MMEQITVKRGSGGRFTSPGTATAGAASLFDSPPEKGGSASSRRGVDFSSSKSASPASPMGSTVQRQSLGAGAFSPAFEQYIPKLVDPDFYETLREAIPIIDTGLQRLGQIDGVIQIECLNDALQIAADDWAESVHVNHFGQGFQSAVSILLGEMYEQGFGLLEPVANADMTDISALWIPDSKNIWFERLPDGSVDVWFQPSLRQRRWFGQPIANYQSILKPLWNGVNGVMGFSKTLAVKLSPDQFSIVQYQPENQEPGGVSAIRSIPFVAKLFAILNNATMSSWERFGDPSYVATYKSGSKRTSDDLQKINQSISTSLRSAISAKRGGGSADLVHTVGKDDDLLIQVLGADNAILQLDIPKTFAIDQIVAGLGLSYSILGLPAMGAAESISVNQVLYASQVQFARHAPMLKSVVLRALRLRGHTFKPGDVRLVQHQPSYDDILKKAQASFMYAQSRRIYGVEFADGPVMVDVGPSPAPLPAPAPPPVKGPRSSSRQADNRKGGAKALLSLRAKRGNLFKEIPITPLVDKTAAAVESAWVALSARAAQKLGLEKSAGAKALTPDEIKMLESLAEDYAGEIMAEGDIPGPLVSGMERIFDLGLENATALSGFGSPLLIGVARSRLASAILALTFGQVKETAFRVMREDIIFAMSDAALAGESPQTAARALYSAFDGSASNWSRLTRTEMASAHDQVKRAEWNIEGVQALTFVVGDVGCAICGPLAGTYTLDACPSPASGTHPSCTCTTRPATRSEIEAAGLSLPDNINPNADLIPQGV